MKFYLGLIIIFLSVNQLFSQKESKVDPAIVIHFSYGFQIPGGDLADDFGTGFSLGSQVEYLMPNNLIFGVNGGIIFGDKVKNDVISDLRASDGFVIGINRSLADIQLKERGFNAGIHIGKLFQFKSLKNRSGLRTTLGVGLLQHKVRIQDDFQAEVPQLNEDYLAGYDQLTNGLSFTEFIGYQYLSSDGLINFKIGVEFIQGFTKNRRSWDYKENRQKNESRIDLVNSLKVSWILPLYFKANPDEIFY